MNRLGKNNPNWRGGKQKCKCGKEINYGYKTCANCKGGWKLSEKSKLNISNAKLAEKNPMWKGDKVGYYAIHQWTKKRILKPIFCQNCKKVPPYDLANISQKYKRDLSDWEWLCRSCQMAL